MATPTPPRATGPSRPKYAVSTNPASGSAVNCTNAGAAIRRKSQSSFCFRGASGPGANVCSQARTRLGFVPGMRAAKAPPRHLKGGSGEFFRTGPRGDEEDCGSGGRVLLALTVLDGLL